jgi:hypothetical protein
VAAGTQTDIHPPKKPTKAKKLLNTQSVFMITKRMVLTIFFFLSNFQRFGDGMLCSPIFAISRRSPSILIHFAPPGSRLDTPVPFPYIDRQIMLNLAVNTIGTLI